MHEFKGPGLHTTQEQSEISGTSRKWDADSEVMAQFVSATSPLLHHIHSRTEAFNKLIMLRLKFVYVFQYGPALISSCRSHVVHIVVVELIEDFVPLLGTPE